MRRISLFMLIFVGVTLSISAQVKSAEDYFCTNFAFAESHKDSAKSIDDFTWSSSLFVSVEWGYPTGLSTELGYHFGKFIEVSLGYGKYDYWTNSGEKNRFFLSAGLTFPMNYKNFAFFTNVRSGFALGSIFYSDEYLLFSVGFLLQTEYGITLRPSLILIDYTKYISGGIFSRGIKESYNKIGFNFSVEFDLKNFF